MVVQDNVSDDGEVSTLKGDKKHRLKQRFDVRQKLGQGTYGKVQLAINRETGQEVAIKTIKKSKIETEQDLIRIRREIQIMSSIQHPQIIHIYEVFENKDKIVLVMQFASGGELYDYLNEKKVLSDLEARRIFRQIAAAVYYCHKNKICHRDLKLENILLDEKGNAKIADFGLSNVFDDRHLLKTYCGSPLYASPEIVKGVPYYGPEVDCWSMGVLLYTLVYGAMPFDGSNFKKLVTQISEGDYFEPKKKSKASGLIHQLLAVNPMKRATIVDICTDFWVNQGYEHSLLQVAEDMAELTPVRLDLLLALAPSSPVPDERLKEETAEENANNPATNEESEDAEEEEDEDEEVQETPASTFEFVPRKLHGSSVDLQQLCHERTVDGEFLPSDVAAALEAHTAKRAAERSFDGSLAHMSSIAHKSKKTRKSDSMTVKASGASAGNITATPSSDPTSGKECSSPAQSETPRNTTPLNDLSKIKSGSEVEMNSPKNVDTINEMGRKMSNPGIDKSLDMQDQNIVESKSDLKNKKIGRAPGKIVIPKTFESPQATPSPKAVKNSPTSPKDKFLPEVARKDSKPNIEAEIVSMSDSLKKVEVEEQAAYKSNTSSSETIGKDHNIEPAAEEKKIFAKGILKKGIAKAKLAERKLSQQSSTESELPTPSTASVKASENVPSFFKTPKPYVKEEEQQRMKSKAEIILSSAAKTADADKAVEVISNTSNAPLWDSISNNASLTQVQNRNPSWGTIASTLDSEMSGWREQMEESLRRLSPDGSAEKSVSPINTPCRGDEEKPLVPIARSYKKFTFTKDGACITETKKIYTTPGADGSWTKVEKKTKITTRPGNAEEFERFRDLHMRNESPLMKSDSQSSSGSNEVYDDIFDSWTGDTMMCNMMKIKNMFHKFSQDPFMHNERRRNPFRNFRRTESDRNERCRRRPELRSGYSTDKEYSDYDEADCDITYAGVNPIVYGSQGLWQFLKSPSKQLPRRVMVSQPERTSFSRSVSQDRSGSKLSNWKHCESRASSGYNTNSRSQSPHEKVLRFVFESPSQEKDCKPQQRKESKAFCRSNSRRDSGINSDGYESEHYYRVPSEDFSKSGRVSPISSTYSSGRQGMIRDFVKSWPKEVMTRHSMGNDMADNRRSKVEQWLHMNDMSSEDFPFAFCSDSPAKMTSRKTMIHDNLSSAYATMRPREYMKYTRSSSDKVSDGNVEFSPFDDTPRLRSMLVHQNLDHEGLKGRVRSATYSPVSEESSRDARSIRHSDSSQSSTSVHQINFTFSDGRVSTSQSVSPHSAKRNVLVSGGIPERTEGNVISVEQITPKGPGQPIVQMRVSFNHGNRDSKVIHANTASPPPSIGLWQQQQDQLSSPKQSNLSGGAREISPVPGIKKFSTEIVHTVGNSPEYQGASSRSRDKHLSGPASVEYAVKTTAHSQKGKSYSSFSPSVCSDAPSDACSEPCMDNARRITNLNLYSHYTQPTSDYVIDTRTITKETFASKSESEDVNTPDSLDDSCVGLHETASPNSIHTDGKVNSSSNNNLSLDIKPLGVLWNNYEVNSLDVVNPKVYSNSFNSYSPGNTYDVRNSISDHEISDEKQRYRVNPLSEIGSIWEQRNNNCQTFDLIKGLLVDEGLDNMISEHPTNERTSNKIRQKKPELLNVGVPPLSMLGPLSVIDYQMDKSAQAEELNGLMPSFMDELQSPQKVLHQALKILKTCE